MNLIIQVGKQISPGDYRNQPVIFRTCSKFKFINNKLVDDIIIYDSNYAFPSFFIQPIPTQNINIAITNATISTNFGDTNDFVVTLVTQFSTLGGAIFYLELQNGFIFQRQCSILVFGYTCTYFEQSQNKIQFVDTGDIIKGKVYQIQLSISNPYFQSSTKLYVQYYNQLNKVQNGQVLCTQQSQNNIAYSSAIQIINQKINYFWGFNYSSSVDFMNKLYVTDTQQTQIQYIYNTVTFYFSVSNNIQHYDQFKLIIRIQNTGIIESSISHNLIPKSGSQVFCRDESYSKENRWQIACYNIGQFLMADTYKISLKVFYEDGHQFDQLNSLNFGDIQIQALNSSGQIVNNVVFYNTQRGITLTSDNFATAGSLLTSNRVAIWGHSLVFNIRENQNIQGDASNYFYNQVISLNTQGIEQLSPASTTQALVFLVNFPNLNDICQNCDVSSGTKQIKMELIYDSTIISYTSNNTDGLLLGQYNTSAQDISNTVLCKNQSQCINYKESVTNFNNYNTKQFYDTVSYSPNYAKYIFRCGDPTIQNGGSIPSKCIFNGDMDESDHSNSIMIMRGVQFKDAFSFTGLSSDTMLDFVFGFKSGDMSCGSVPCTIDDSAFALNKAFIIHAYVITGKLSSISNDIRYKSLVNYYQSNSGELTPTFYRFRGLFTAIPSTSDKIGIFFDSSLQLQFIMNQGQTDLYQNVQIEQMVDENEQKIKSYMFRSDNSYNCLVRISLTATRTCKLIKGQSKQNDNNIWYLNSGVLVNLIEANQYFDIYIPVQTGSVNPKYTSLVFFSSSMKVLGVYQINYNNDYTNSYSYYINTSYTINNASNQIGRNLDNPGQSWNYSLDGTYNPSSGSYSFSYKSPQSGTIDIGYGSQSIALNEYGAGLTILCKGVDFYPDAGMTLGTSESSSGNYDTTSKCFSFSYRLLFKRKNYIAFCPFDNGLFPVNSTNADTTSGKLIINITNARLNNLPASFYSDQFTYSLSKRDGIAISLNLEQGNIINPSPILRSVITSILPTTIYINYPKSQPFAIKITLDKSIKLISVDTSSALQNGIKSLKFLFQLVTLNVTNLYQQCSVLVSNQEIGTCYVQWESQKLAVYAIVKKQFDNVQELNISLRLLQNINSVPDLSNIACDVYVNTDVSGENWFYGNSISTLSTFLLLFNGTVQSQNLFNNGQQSNRAINFQYLNLTSNMEGGLATLQMGFQLGQQDSNIQFESSLDLIEVDLGWLSNQQDIRGIQCIVFQGNQISYDWQRIKYYSNKLNLFAQSSSNINNYQLQQTITCYNILIPHFDDQNRQITISWLEGQSVIQKSSQSYTYSSQNLSNVNLLNVKLNKKMGGPLIDSDYFFEIFTQTQLIMNSAFFIRFDYYIPSSLNTQTSNVDCYINEQSTVCGIDDQRLVKIPIYDSFPANSQITLQIKGVSQPSKDFMKQSKVYIAVSQLGQYNLADSGNYVTDKVSQNDIISFSILSIDQLNSTQLNQNNYKIVTKLPYNVINHNFPIYIDMFPSPYYFNNSLLICQLFSNDDLGQHNWVKNCSFSSSKRIEIWSIGTNWNMSSLIQQSYTIMLFNIFTNPCYIDNSPFNSFGVKILIPFSNQNFIQYQSYLVNQNDIIYFNSNSSQQIQIQNSNSTNILQSNFQCMNQLYIPKGYFSEIFYFQLPNQGTLFPSTITLQFDDSKIKYFQISNQIIQLEAGNLISEGFQIGAYMNTSNGQYFLNLKKNQYFNNDYKLLLYSIGIQVTEKQCPINKIIISPTNVYVPVYGKSQPIKIDFINCIPVDKLTVFGLIAQINGISYYTFDQEQITLYSNQSNTYIKFIVINVLAPPTNIVFTPSIKWQIIGKNSKQYEGINDISITSVDQTTVNSNPAVTYVGLSEQFNQINATVQCSTQGSIYYMAFLTLYPQPVDINNIIMKTQSGLIDQTFRDPMDPSWTIYGFQLLNEKNIANAVFPTMIGSQYQFNVYCQSLLSKISDIYTSQITTSDNSLINYQLQFQFQQVLNSIQKIQLACLLSQSLSIPLDLIFTDELTVCNHSIFNQIFYSTNTSNTSRRNLQEQINDARQPQTFDSLYFVQDLTIGNKYAATTSTYYKLNKLAGNSVLLSQILSQFNIPFPPLISPTPSLISWTSDLLSNVLQATYYSMKSNSSYVEIKLQIQNDGFLLFGIEKVSKMKTPNYIQLFYGLNGNNNKLSSSYKMLVTNSQYVSFKVNNLESNIEYVLYWSGAPQNPSIYSINSGISKKFFISIYEGPLSNQKLRFVILQFLISLLLLNVIY